MKKCLALCLCLCAVLLACNNANKTRQAIVPTGKVKVLAGAILIDGTGRPKVPDSLVVIEGDKIVQVGQVGQINTPQGAEVIDVKGKYLIPGLSDMHQHIASERGADSADLSGLLAWGITNVFDLGASKSLFADFKQASQQELASFPHYTGVIQTIGAPGGFGGSDFGGISVDTVEEAQAVVLEFKELKADGIKIVYDDLSWYQLNSLPVLKPEVLQALITESHRQGLKAYIHAPIHSYAIEALRAGADGLVHGVVSEPVNDEFIQLLKQNQATYVATHAIFEAAVDLKGWTQKLSEFDVNNSVAREVYDYWGSQRASDDHYRIATNIDYVRQRLSILRQNSKTLIDAGVQMLVGSDTNAAGLPLGISSVIEYSLLVEAGLTPMQVIQAGTLNAAVSQGREASSGSIEAGKQADILLLDADPLADIGNIRFIHRVVRAGVIYDPQKIFN